MRKLLSFMFLLYLGFLTTSAQVPVIMDMVHHNPGEAFTSTQFTNPDVLAAYGYNAQVINEFTPPHCALTFDAVSKDIFPENSPERQWVLALRQRIQEQIRYTHAHGLKAYYFMDIILLPKNLVEMYKDELLGDDGKIDWDRPMTKNLHRIMLDELFEVFPDLDGFVVRTGENYRHNIPYHTGNELERNSREEKAIRKHAELVSMLREEVCVKRGKSVIYRSWDIEFNEEVGRFHTKPNFYLGVVNQVEPHPLLLFSIKHTRGDYWRHMPFNPCLGLGQHKQIVEVQCQREYEGKGAYANYVAGSIINGFEEEDLSQPSYHSLNELKASPLFHGLWTWTRGGGWGGPYIKNEFWCGANAYVLSKWFQTGQTPSDLFVEYAREQGFDESSAKLLNILADQSAHAVLLSRGSKVVQLKAWDMNWTRDDNFQKSNLASITNKVIAQHKVKEFIHEKEEACRLWKAMERKARKLEGTDKEMVEGVKASFTYGRLFCQTGTLVLKLSILQAQQEQDGTDRSHKIQQTQKLLDRSFDEWESFCTNNPYAATCYERQPK